MLLLVWGVGGFLLLFLLFILKRKKGGGRGLALSDYWCKRKKAGLVKSHFLKIVGEN